MKGYECFKVAVWNIAKYKRMSVKVIVGFTTVIMLLFCLLTYKSAFDQQMTHIENKYQDNCYLQKYLDEHWENYDRVLKEVASQKEELGISKSILFNTLNIKPKNKNEYVDTAINKANFVVEGKEYEATSDILEGINIDYSYWEAKEISMELWNAEHSPFSNLDPDFEKTKFLTGTLLEQEGEIIISDVILSEFGITEEMYQQLLGKKITLYVQNKKYVACKDYILTGIFKASQLGEHYDETTIWDSSHIYVNLRKEDQKNVALENVRVQYYVEGYENLMTYYEKAIETDKDIELSMVGAIYEAMSKHIGMINEILSYVITGFVFAVTVYLFCILYFYFSQNQNYAMMLQAIGMQRKNQSKIVAWELFIFNFISLAIGVYVGLFILFGLKKLYHYGMSIKVEFDAGILVRSGVVAVTYCLVLSGCFALWYTIKQKKVNVAEKLRAGN